MVLNKKNLIYIGRPSVYGNPFTVGIDGTRGEVCAKHNVYMLERIKKDPEFKKLILALKGKDLLCFCKPLQCHGDNIEKYLESINNEQGIFENL